MCFQSQLAYARAQLGSREPTPEPWRGKRERHPGALPTYGGRERREEGGSLSVGFPPGGWLGNHGLVWTRGGESDLPQVEPPRGLGLTRPLLAPHSNSGGCECERRVWASEETPHLAAFLGTAAYPLLPTFALWRGSLRPAAKLRRLPALTRSSLSGSAPSELRVPSPRGSTSPPTRSRQEKEAAAVERPRQAGEQAGPPLMWARRTQAS